MLHGLRGQADPTFYMDEADHNRFDRPRLDFVVSFDDGQEMRYHPGTDYIWLPANADMYWQGLYY